MALFCIAAGAMISSGLFILLGMLQMGIDAFLIGIVLIVIAFLVYWFYGHPRAQHESALIHLIERIAAKELTTGDLEAKLKHVIRHRDGIVVDRFNEIIMDCAIVDVTHPLSSNELFHLAAEKLSRRLRICAKSLSDALETRERESSTVITPHAAIPHVVIEGHCRFDLLLARSKKGFRFGPDRQNVHAVFVLVGTKDQGHFHLQAISAVVRVVQEPDFEKEWLLARRSRGMRDLVMHAERRRHRARPNERSST